MLQRVPQQARADPNPDQGCSPGWFLAKEAWPSPSDRVLASPQRGLKNTIFLLTLGTCGSPARGCLPTPLNPGQHLTVEFHPEAPRI